MKAFQHHQKATKREIACFKNQSRIITYLKAENREHLSQDSKYWILVLNLEKLYLIKSNHPFLQ